MYENHSDWRVSKSLPNNIVMMAFLIMAGGMLLQSANHEAIITATSLTMSVFGAFFLFAATLKVRVSPYSSRSGARASEIVLSSIPESILITSTLYGFANISIYLMQTYSFVGTNIWTFLNTPVTVVGWLLSEGFLAFVSLLARTGD